MIINENVKSIVNGICEDLVNLDYEIIFGGADGIICKRNDINANELLKNARGRCNGFNFSIGIGNSLKDSYIALRYAKSNGKNVATLYENDNFVLVK